MSDAELHRKADQFLVRALRRAELSAEAAPPGLNCRLLVRGSGGRSTRVHVLVRPGPQRRGGGLNLGMHWMLSSTDADQIALVDISRRKGWFLSVAEFRRRARAGADGRYHLDWIVARLGRTRTTIADEGEFDSYTFPRALPQLARRLRR